ncbi:hypothetical protein [Povalibacter sp.]|uniref:hypothetical protein n=1 Tax=Povalibacter sp. TaxID=1962978 RepID=UPI002F3F9929
MKKTQRYRAIKTKDHGAGGYSWVVFDITQTNKRGEHTYVADCINVTAARLVADALNSCVTARPRKR